MYEPENICTSSATDSNSPLFHRQSNSTGYFTRWTYIEPECSEGKRNSGKH